ncbi:hypothetical protein ACJMK2_043146 [Sinanodonta woodiana]|uniref:TAF1C beta-propeller domain-containing protein n=1 Tax=Sinanodonta woodiana TaxID=1069815 RepID=A0ABD3VZ87_SINWO
MDREFPNVSFPYSFPLHETKRELFADFGTYGQLDVDQTEDSAVKFVTQRLTNNPVVDLCASHPTLPLSTCPTPAMYPFPDRVNDKSVQIWKAWNDLLPRLRICKSLLPVFKQDFLRDLIQGNPVSEAQWFSDLLEKYEVVSSVRELPSSNSQYTGGALSYLPCTDNGGHGYMISAAGCSFSSIKIQSVQNASDKILKSQELSTLPVPGHIYQTTCNSVHNKDFCAIRLECSCVVYTLSSNEDKSSVELTELGQKMCPSTIMAISLSPYIPAECLITSEDGSCLLWNFSQSTCEEVVSARSPRFQCHDPWHHTHFGAHPRQLVYADSTAVELFDLRKKTGSVDLFCLPSKFLHKRERIRSVVAQSDSSFYHLMATDYSLILLDERFPGYPVLKWQHLLKSPPRYLSRSPYSSTEIHSVFVGSQYPPEVVCLRYQQQRGLPPQAISVPWRASKKSDFIYWPGVANGPDKYLAEERLNLSLAGQAVSTTDSESILFQMDSLGDIFYQVYSKRQSDKEDVTFSAGPGSADLQLSYVAMKTGSDWLKNLIQQKIQDGPNPNKCFRADSSEVFGAVIKEKLVHCFCALCIPPTQNETRQLTSPEEMYCLACTHSVGTTYKIAESTIKDCILDADYDSMKLLESQVSNVAEENHPSATSKLLRKLWDGDPDIQDVLVERDKEIQEIRKELQKQKQLNTPDLGLMEKLLQDVHQYHDDVLVDNEEESSDNDLHGDQLNESSVLHATPNLDNSFEKLMDDNLKLTSPCPFDSDISLINRTPHASKRKRHSSMSSVGSVLSQRSSSSIPGFGATPLKKCLQQNSLGRPADVSVSSPVTGSQAIGMNDTLASSGAGSPFAVSGLQCQQSDGSKTSGKGDQSSDWKQSETVSQTDPESDFFSQSQEHFTIFSSQSQLSAPGQSQTSSNFGDRTMSPLKLKRKSLFDGF